MKKSVKLNKRKSDGVYYCFIRNSDGKRIGRAVGKDHRKALQQKAHYERLLELGEIDFGTNHTKTETFSDLVSAYLETVEKRLKHSTFQGYDNLISSSLIPKWGHKRIGDITKDDVKKLLDDRKNRGLDSNNLRVCISAILQFAVESDLLKENVARNLGKMYSVKRSKNGLAQKQIQFLTKDQVETLLASAKAEFPKWYDFLLLLFRTGLRVGEASALCWDSVDFENKQIHVRRNFTHNRWETPKSHKSRFVLMSENLMETLRQRQEQQPQPTCPSYKDKTGEDIKLVFAKENGGVVNVDLFRAKVFKRLLAKAGLPPMRLHDIRHTFASELLKLGAPIHFVKEQLGHASITTTIDRYAHCQNGDGFQYLNKLD